MAKFCTNCGSPSVETARFCNKCGAKLAPTQPAQEPPGYAPPPETYQAPPAYQPSPLAPAPAAGMQANVAGALCYALTIVTGVIFLVLYPYSKDRFVRFHAFQAIFFFIAWVVLSMAISILSNVLPWFIGGLLSMALALGGLALWLFLMYKAYSNEKYKLPVIGEIAEQQAG